MRLTVGGRHSVHRAGPAHPIEVKSGEPTEPCCRLGKASASMSRAAPDTKGLCAPPSPEPTSSADPRLRARGRSNRRHPGQPTDSLAVGPRGCLSRRLGGRQPTVLQVLSRIQSNQAASRHADREPVLPVESGSGRVAGPPGRDDGKKPGLAHIPQVGRPEEARLLPQLPQRR
jgi:hypothetical protein